jgi:predicted AAA+ superfamily ATPase
MSRLEELTRDTTIKGILQDQLVTVIDVKWHGSVLRLMASVISELWERNDSSLLIMPASIPMDSANVQSEMTQFTRHFYMSM